MAGENSPNSNIGAWAESRAGGRAGVKRAERRPSAIAPLSERTARVMRDPSGSASESKLVLGAPQETRSSPFD